MSEAAVKAAIRQYFSSLLLFFLVFGSITLSIFFDLPQAYADVRRSDVILGSTMDSRGLPPTMCPSISAEHACLVSSDGQTYFERDADAPVQIASITKVMTAILALENSGLDETVEVSSAAASVGESSAKLQAGDTLSMSDLLIGLMLPSGNDAATAIAEYIGQKKLLAEGIADATASDAQQRFIEAMNDRAAQLGCTNTVYTNPHGLDNDSWAGDQHSTARDVATVAAAAMQNETFRDIVARESATITVIRQGSPVQIELETTDELLGTYEGACGIKTGSTGLAGDCFLGAYEKDGEMLIAVLLDAADEQARFVDATTLYEWVEENQVDYALADSSETAEMTVDGETSEVPVVAAVGLDSWIDKTVRATLEDPEATVPVFAANGNVSQEIQFYTVDGAVNAGDVVGHASFYQRNVLLAEADLIAVEDVEAPDFFTGIAIWWQKLLRSISGDETSAQSVIINRMQPLIERS